MSIKNSNRQSNEVYDTLSFARVIRFINLNSSSPKKKKTGINTPLPSDGTGKKLEGTGAKKLF